MRFIAPPPACPASREALDRFRTRTTAALRAMLGVPPFDAQPPLDPRILYVTDEGGYRRAKVRYGGEEDDVVWAWLLTPKQVEAPVPAVICLPGTFMTPNWGKDAPAGLAGPENRGDPEAYGADLARLGYVTLCPDYPCAGERTTPGLKSHDTTEWDRRFPGWTRVGMSAWDVSRAVDFLHTIPEADPHRIGCTGWSQGGQMTLLGAALEPRIAAIATVCGWSPLRGLPGGLTENLVRSYNYPGLREYAERHRPLPFDMDHVAASIAPRPFLDVRGRRDVFFPNVHETEHGIAEIEKVYALAGAQGRFRCCWYDGKHAHNATAAREVQAWFYRWLWAKGSR